MHESDVEVLQQLWLSGDPEMPPEPRTGQVCSASQFPGAGFMSAQVMDYDAMNSWAAVYGWTCRFKLDPMFGPMIYYPKEP